MSKSIVYSTLSEATAHGVSETHGIDAQGFAKAPIAHLPKGSS